MSFVSLLCFQRFIRFVLSFIVRGSLSSSTDITHTLSEIMLQEGGKQAEGYSSLPFEEILPLRSGKRESVAESKHISIIFVINVIKMLS